MAALREVVETKGLFCSLYSDRGSHFFVTPKAGQPVDKTRLTQVGRAMRELNVQMMAACSPQARGRSERNFGTWQNRLPQELRLAGIGRVEAANRFLRDRYIAEFHERFSRPAREKGTAFRKCGRTDLDLVFSIQTERTVDNDNTVAIRDRYWQLDKTRFRRTLADCRVTTGRVLKTKPKRQTAGAAWNILTDKCCVNKTGQLEKLTTGGSVNISEPFLHPSRAE